MPSKPTYEELEARVAALELAALTSVPNTPFKAEVAGPPQPEPVAGPGKTYEAPRPQRVRVPSDLIAIPGVLPIDPAVLAGQIAQLRTVIVSGVNSAGYGDKRTEFRSLAELRQILADMEEDLADLLGGPGSGRIRQIRMTTQADKGL